MKIIYKYELDSPRKVLELPWGAQALTVQLQRNTPVLWALIEQSEVRTVRRMFVAINTGDPFDAPVGAYYGTITSDNGIVWHIFEVQ